MRDPDFFETLRILKPKQRIGYLATNVLLCVHAAISIALFIGIVMILREWGIKGWWVIVPAILFGLGLVGLHYLGAYDFLYWKPRQRIRRWAGIADD